MIQDFDMDKFSQAMRVVSDALKDGHASADDINDIWRSHELKGFTLVDGRAEVMEVNDTVNSLNPQRPFDDLEVYYSSRSPIENVQIIDVLSQVVQTFESGGMEIEIIRGAFEYVKSSIEY